MCELYLIDSCWIGHIEIEDELVGFNIFLMFANAFDVFIVEDQKECIVVTMRIEVSLDGILASVARMLLDSSDNLS